MRYETILAFARDMRKNPTPAEKFFWEKVKNRLFYGYKFYRQYIVESASFNGDKCFFIADFYCHKNMILIELDGSIHFEQKEFDALRQLDLQDMGYSVIRFNNSDVIHNWSFVESSLLQILMEEK